MSCSREIAWFTMVTSSKKFRVALLVVATLVVQRLVTTMISSWTPSVYESALSPLSTHLRPHLPADTVTPSTHQGGIKVDVSDLSDTNHQRLSLLRRRCAANRSHYISNRSRLETLDEFLLDSKRGLVFCYIPKVGSSTMKRIFQVLAGNNRGRGILQISSEKIHSSRHSFGWFGKDLASETFLRKHFILRNSTKFLFVRDPYERIFSGFVDRVYNFGVMWTLRIIMKEMLPNQSYGNVCEFAVKLKFKDIIDYITTADVTSLDEHFRPYYVDCFPCVLNYDFIGKLETFKEDITTVLSAAKVNVTSVLGNVSDFDTRNNLNILLDVGVRTFTMLKDLSCMTKQKMLERTWQTLQFAEALPAVYKTAVLQPVRGLLPVDVPFPVKDNGTDISTTEDFKQLLLTTFNQIQDREAVKRQKEAAFRDAFYSLPRPLLKKLQALVQRDCDLFGYECDVNVRFNETERRKPMFHF